MVEGRDAMTLCTVFKGSQTWYFIFEVLNNHSKGIELLVYGKKQKKKIFQMRNEISW